jgi:hypothetical protein
MCEKCGCKKPDEKKPCEAGEKKTEECTPEQIAKCRPDADGHPCEEKKEEPKQDDCPCCRIPPRRA